MWGKKEKKSPPPEEIQSSGTRKKDSLHKTATATQTPTSILGYVESHIEPVTARRQSVSGKGGRSHRNVTGFLARRCGDECRFSGVATHVVTQQLSPWGVGVGSRATDEAPLAVADCNSLRSRRVSFRVGIEALYDYKNMRRKKKSCRPRRFSNTELFDRFFFFVLFCPEQNKQVLSAYVKALSCSQYENQSN